VLTDDALIYKWWSCSRKQSNKGTEEGCELVIVDMNRIFLKKHFCVTKMHPTLLCYHRANAAVFAYLLKVTLDEQSLSL